MKSKRVISLLAVAALATTIFVGCGNKEEAKKSGLKDGTYTEKSEKDERGYEASIEIEVKDGKIAAVKYDEVGEKGSKKDDTEYNAKMKEAKGTNPSEAFPKLEESLVEKQDVASVDVVTGATSSSDSFKTLAEKALGKAK